MIIIWIFKIIYIDKLKNTLKMDNIYNPNIKNKYVNRDINKNIISNNAAQIKYGLKILKLNSNINF